MVKCLSSLKNNSMSNYYQPTSNISLLKQLFGTTYAFDSNANEFKTKINLSLPGDLVVGTTDTSFNLYLNGNAVVTSITISDSVAAGVSNWAEYPAVSNVNLAGFDITNTSNITTTNIDTATINGLPFDPSGATDARLVITAANSIYIGLSAGSNDSGASRSIGIGFNAALNSSGDGVVALGDSAALGNTRNNVVALGTETALSNTGANVCAIINGAAAGNLGTNVIAIGNNAGLNNSGDYVTLMGYLAGNSNTGGDIVAFGQDVANSNSGSHVNALGTRPGFQILV
jgi:hypothetical protein